ncbi:hypothetical protein D8B26_007245 [Coccidioides posadasii str. Silveira]|uniref:Uncharacterized protein n=3 Tax=Coccidioides posadasii TaxID=199306 RepID=E9D368_COCPS|nr:fad oxidoreductase, putative [Coccidioides posadasii C735 delta SOWgp]EER29972.1 fad oxidoreductase, putative [Coccidioides posadasii C735 delta SOWgp]EFW19063.1 conserved hypothetical protein [Coccidioides posadasii str. Silveira]KMM71405.1 FAD-dependent oxidoreductase family protein [Coccidioides posadasii RMSCC 3488]QVM12626.1 hypothetical protein D8B26_007245 [Coccidioides posadasii str. Silveira]|eukprot:XP_003072117.1 fad oxidoreductase, putative [Coccidioides posadasii C735 delta SOWgp]
MERTIVVVGGGIIGSCIAYFLTRHPSYDSSRHKVIILEATEIAGGASGKAGGLLALWAYPSNIVPLSFRLHAQLAEEHNGKEKWGYRKVNCGQLMAHVLPKRTSSTESSNKSSTKQAVSLEKRTEEAIALLRAAGVPSDLDWFDPLTLSGYEEMGDPGTTAQVHPYLFTTSMAKLAEEKGANVIFGLVTEIEQVENGASTVKYTEKETGESKSISATDVVISAGPWTRSIFPRAPITALRAHSVVIRPTRPVSPYAIFSSITLAADSASGRPSQTSSAPEIYARPDNTVYACGEGDRSVPLPSTTAEVEVDDSRCQTIINSVSVISPELRDGEVLARQACYLPNVAAKGIGPLIGPTDIKGVYLAAGHTCWGIQNAPGTGKVMSEMIFDGEAKSAHISSLDPRKIL